jgi:hypothetical protein
MASTYVEQCGDSILRVTYTLKYTTRCLTNYVLESGSVRYEDRNKSPKTREKRNGTNDVIGTDAMECTYQSAH